MYGKIGAIILALILLAALFCGVICTEKVPAGYVGVVYNMNGGVDGEILTQGWHLVSPTKKVTTYSIGIEQSYRPPITKAIPGTTRALASPLPTAKLSGSIWNFPTGSMNPGSPPPSSCLRASPAR